MREQLFNLIGQVQDCGCDVTDVVAMNFVENDKLVDWLIANGVVIPVRCKDCKQYNGHRYCTYFAETVLDNDFCSYGERRTDNERKAD